MRVLITGSSGFLGRSLLENLLNEGHEVYGLRRENSAEDTPHWNPEKGDIQLGNFFSLDTVIHLAGENLVGGRWNDRRKSRILDSRINGTKLISDFLAGLNPKPRLLISASAIGYYGDCREVELDENGPVGTGFLPKVCHQWEEATISAKKAGIRVVNLRIGMVLSKSDGALRKMHLPFKIGLGGVIGNGKQYMSWISIKDFCDIIQFIMNNESIEGPVNLVSPSPVSNYEFTKTLGRVLDRPTILPLPAFMAKIIFGDEFAQELLLSSSRIIPRKLLDAGYRFQYPRLEDTLRSLLKKGERKL
ncbi:MAG: TIGR01777 family protein [Proteobacteria bacterium]|nr:TIGR01777 family protein [Pseudomonadota bacterium]